MKTKNHSLRVNDVFKVYPLEKRNVIALKGLTALFDPGMIHVVMGPSGSGKTTLANIIMGWEPVTGGSIEYKEHVLSYHDTSRQHHVFNPFASYVSQFPSTALFSDLSVQENIFLFTKFKNRDYAKSLEQIHALGIEELLGSKVSTLSFGESMRLLLSLHILDPPAILILDEPTAQLDHENVKKVQHYLLQLKSKKRIIVILTHDFRMLQIADTLTLLRDGKVTHHSRMPQKYLEKTQDITIEELLPFLAEESLQATKKESKAEKAKDKKQEQKKIVVQAFIQKNGDTILPKPILDYYDFTQNQIFYEFDEKTKKYYIANPRRPVSHEKQRQEKPIQERIKEILNTIARPLSQEPIIQLQNINKRFSKPKRQVFKDLTFSIKTHDFITIIGPSGSGKSTLLSILAGIEPVNQGNIKRNARILRQQAKDKLQHLAFINQENNFLPFYTMKENLLLWAQQSWQVLQSQLTPYLRLLELTELLDKYPHQLSGGELKRFSVIAGLGRAPALLLLDEPTANLNHELALKMIYAILSYYVGSVNRTIVFVTHDLKYIPPNASIYEIQQGRLIPRENTFQFLFT